jgi:hypothetical protein
MFIYEYFFLLSLSKEYHMQPVRKISNPPFKHLYAYLNTIVFVRVCLLLPPFQSKLVIFFLNTNKYIAKMHLYKLVLYNTETLILNQME